MVDERPDEKGSPTGSDRPRRAPPTIDLEATEISTAAEGAGDAPDPPAPEFPPKSPVTEPAPRPVSPWIIAPVAGASAAALVIGVGWMLGWPPIQPASAPQPHSAAVEGLSARITGLESKISKPATDPAASARAEAAEKAVAALRGELAAARAQSEQLASVVNELKSAPRGDGAASPDLSAIGARLARLESEIKAQGAEIAAQAGKIADAGAANAKPADDVPLRRVVASALLDVLVRGGDPYKAALSAAKSLAAAPDALKPLDPFADTGVPNAGKLSAELLALALKLLPATQQDTATAGSGIVDRLQAGAARLVKIERTDTAGNDRAALVARITAAAQRNDSNEARRELKTLAPADRAAAQAWLDKADARDAALAASRQFAADAMATLGKPAQ